MKKTLTLAWHVVPNKGTCLIKNAPAYEIDFYGLKLNLCKLFNKWGIYDPKSGMSGAARFATLKEAKAFAGRNMSDPKKLAKAKENAGRWYKTVAALEIGNFIEHSSL